MFKYKDGDRVTFTYAGMTGVGEIVGCSTTEMPIIGRMYIIRLIYSTPTLPNESYPFKVITLPEHVLLLYECDANGRKL